MDGVKLAYTCTLKNAKMDKPKLLVVNVCVFVITAAIALVWVPLEGYWHGFDAVEITATLVLFFATGLSITAGYHRLWSHKTYQANGILKVILAVGGAMALQNSILHWAADHRIHHKHVDNNDRDPYSAKRGFCYSHIGWMLRDYQGQRYGDYSNCRDLQKDKIVMWQHNNYLLIMLSANFGIPMLLGWLNGDILGMLLLAGVFRLVLVHHATFLINSLAHRWGRQTYTESNTAKDNGFIALFTFGEGYHNFHHIFEYDYRNGIKWWHYDPTKWLIRSLSWVGWTSNLRRCPEERIEKARLAMQLQQTRNKLETLQLPNADSVLLLIQQEYDELTRRMKDYYATKRRMVEIRKRKLKRDYERFELDCHYEELKQKFQLQQRKWLKIRQLDVLVTA